MIPLILAAFVCLYLASILVIGWSLVRFSIKRPKTNRSYRSKLLPPSVRELASHYRAGEKAFMQEAFEELYLECDGQSLHAYLLRAQEGVHPEGLPETLTLLVHGWQDRAQMRMADAMDYYQAGFSVLVPDLRSHGKSTGKYIDMGCVHRDDLKAWVRLYQERFYPQAQDFALVLDGVSMGAATVLSLAGDSEHPKTPMAIVADCGYTSVMAEALYLTRPLIWPVRLPALMVANFLTKILAGFSAASASPLEQISKSTLPLFVIHGVEDRFVPFKMGYQIYEASLAKIKAYWPVSGAKHADSVLCAGPLYMERKLNFLRQAYRGDDLELFTLSRAEAALLEVAKHGKLDRR